MEVDVIIQSPDEGATVLLRPKSEKGDMVMTQNEFNSSPADISHLDMIEVIGTLTKAGLVVEIQGDKNQRIGYVTPDTFSELQ